MHLDATSSGLKVGSEIKEGQQIGIMGRSGSNGQFDKDYKSHLHYEISVNGTNINPANGANHLVDPQQIIDSSTPTQQPEYNGGTLLEVTVVGQSPEAPQRPLPEISVPEIILKKIEIIIQN
jgi:murein DD-endopeptidase MepM/ murein hydrolase activator NlpD